MQTTRFDFRLGFLTDRNEIKKISVPHARHTASAGEVADAMQKIINTDVVQSLAGSPKSKTGAELIRTERREFII